MYWIILTLHNINFDNVIDRRSDCAIMIRDIENEQQARGFVSLRKHLRFAALNNIMGSVFGRRYDQVRDREELQELTEIVSEGFELLGAFNWSDYLPSLISYFYDPVRVEDRCSKLVPRVKKLVQGIINKHRLDGPKESSDGSDFVDVLLSLEGEEKLRDDDMIAVLWVWTSYIICYLCIHIYIYIREN